MSRFLLILILLWQPLALQVAGMPAVIDHASSSMECCEIIETLSCCEKPTTEILCGVTGGECRCDIAPALPHAPAPALPSSRSTELSLALMALDGEIFVIMTPNNSRMTRPGVQGRFTRSRNTFQASIGIWRI